MTDKTSTRIALRGKLDTLNSGIIFLQTCSVNEKFIADLEELREIIRALQKCEARGMIYNGSLELWGMSFDEIHTRSHNPGKAHILLHHDMKREAAGINLLRACVRECELLSCKVFHDDELGINHVLNRLSSALYVLIYKYMPDDYDRFMKFSNA